MRARCIKSIIGVSAVLAVLSIPASAYAGNDKETASETLRRLMKELEAEGMERVTGPTGTAVREGGIGAVRVKLEQARPYRLTVVADDDASKLAVIVVDRNTKTVALQQAVDGRVLQANLAAPFTGSYEVAVRIGTCNVQPCGYRITLHAPPSTGIRQLGYAPVSLARPAGPLVPSVSTVFIATGEMQ